MHRAPNMNFGRALAGLACLAAIAAAARAVEIELTRLDGQTVRGELLRVNPEIALSTADGELAFTWAETLALETLGDHAAPASSGPLQFALVDGSSFSGRIDGVNDSGVIVEIADGHAGRVDLPNLRAILSTNPGSAARDKLRELADDPQRSADVAIVERGENAIVLRGAVRELTSEHVSMTWNKRDVQLPWSRVAGVFFAQRPNIAAKHTIRLVGGDVFAGIVVGGDADKIVLRSTSFDGLELDWSRIDRVDCRSGHLVYLSDLEPLRYDFTPFFQKKWDYARDATLSGRPIMLGGREYTKGLTMHSRSSLSFNLDGAFRRFAAIAGVVDEMNGRGDVVMAVVGDGRVLWEASGVRGGQPPREVLVDVEGVRELSLHVDYGEDLDLSDHACWAQARLIR